MIVTEQGMEEESGSSSAVVMGFFGAEALHDLGTAGAKDCAGR